MIRYAIYKGPHGHSQQKDRVDVLLVYPVWVRKGSRGELQRMLPPLGILSIASYLEQNGYLVRVIDLHAEGMPPAEFRSAIAKLKPRYIGITVLSAHYTCAHHLATICKQEVPDAKIFVGGVHAEAAPGQMLRNPFIDAVCRGDGEETMLELVREIPYREIPGLSYRLDGRVVHNPPRKAAQDLDQYPFPAYHLLDLDRYFPPAGSYRDLPAVNVLMTRGCPGRCRFCNSADTALRSRSVDKTIQLIKLLRYEHGIRQVYFYDDTFTANPKQVREFCRMMIEQSVDVKWVCYVRGDMFQAADAELMARAGCHQVLIGVESGSEALMREIGKPIQKEKYIKAAKIARQFGIEVRASFIIGHLGETRRTMQETLDFAKEMNPDFLQLSIMTPYPGTMLFEEAKKRGLLLHEDYSRYGQGEPVMRLDHLSSAELLAFERRAFFSFYLRPVVLWRQIKRLTRWSQAKDLITAAHVLFLRGMGARKDPLREWLDFDLETIALKSIETSMEPRLTFEVRRA